MTSAQIKYLHKLVLKHSDIAPWYLSNIKAIRWINERLHLALDERMDLATLDQTEATKIITQLELL